MPTVSIENNSKGDLIFYDFNIYNICPFTLDRVKDCKVRNSIFNNQLCFFMLEPCYFPKQDKFKRIAFRR